MNVGRILFLAIFLLTASSILATGSLVEKMIYDSILDPNTLLITQAEYNRELRDKYRKNLLLVLNEFAGDDISYSNLEERLLNITVPPGYKDLHFSLVTALSDLDANQSAPNLVRDRLEKLKSTYAWLAANLSFIIANNF